MYKPHPYVFHTLSKRRPLLYFCPYLLTILFNHFSMTRDSRTSRWVLVFLPFTKINMVRVVTFSRLVSTGSFHTVRPLHIYSSRH